MKPVPHSAAAPALAMALAMVLAHPVLGDSINVDFCRDPTSPLGGVNPVLHAATGPAPDSGTIWNDFSVFIPDTNGNSSTADDVIATPYLVSNLVDSSGAATTVDVELTSGWYRAFNNSVYANTMQKEWVFANSGNAATLTVTGLAAGSSYHFYLIGSGSFATTYTIGATTKSATAVQMADTASWVENAQYVVFSNVAANESGTIVIGVQSSVSGNGTLAAMQIVPAGGSPPAITSFTASASYVQRPALPMLSWEVTGTITSLVISPGVGDVTASTNNGIGSIAVSPIGDQTYTLTLNGVIQQSLNVIGLPVKEKLHVYLLIGQSNMQGEGTGYNAALDSPDPRVIKFGSRSDPALVDFFTGGHRLTNTGWTAGSDIGMGVEFGKTLIAAQSDPEVVVCLINHAVGGTAIQWWEPGVTNPTYKNPVTNEYYKLYDEAIQRATAASSYGVIKGVLWHQGEYNANNNTTPTPSDPAGYAARLQALVDNLRADLGGPGLPFICGKMVPGYPFPGDRAAVENALADLPNQRSNTFCADNDGLTANVADPIHFNAASQRILGQRYAGAILGFHSNPYLFYLGGFLTPAGLLNAQLTDPHADNDDDGFGNFLEFAFLTNPALAASKPAIGNGSLSIPGEGEFPTISFRQRLDTEAPAYSVEVSSDLLAWTDNGEGPAVTDAVGQGVDNGDGTITVTVRALTPITPANAPCFLRVRVGGE
jgi:hypothetical protein